MVENKETKESKYCLRCGRKLKTEEAIKRGMGKTCWKKSQTSTEKKPLFDKGSSSTDGE